MNRSVRFLFSLADVGADPALVYVFQKTGVYICDENEERLPKEKLNRPAGAKGVQTAKRDGHPQ